MSTSPPPASTEPAAPPHAAHTHWQGPLWTLALLLAGLSTIGPFSVDTYLPAFAAMEAGLRASPLQLQQTLSAYLFGFAFMQLFHGAMADAFGRRPVVLWGLAIFTLASLGCTLTRDVHVLIALRALQGMSAGAGMVLARVIIRDLFDPVAAQKMMAKVTLFFGVAPAIAPMIGGAIISVASWPWIFAFLTAVGGVLWLVILRQLPETLAAPNRHPFNLRNLMHGYRDVGADTRFLLLALTSSVPFNGMFIYILSSPTFLGKHLGLAPTQFFWLFCVTIGGIMAGAALSGRLAGRITPRRQVALGYALMGAMAVINVAANALMPAALPWALLPAGLIALGWAMAMPAVTLLVLDTFPTRRGMASSLQGAMGGAFNGLTAGVIAPIAMVSPLGLAIASALMIAAGWVAWWLVRARVQLQ